MEGEVRRLALTDVERGHGQYARDLLHLAHEDAGVVLVSEMEKVTRMVAGP